MEDNKVTGKAEDTEHEVKVTTSVASDKTESDVIDVEAITGVFKKDNEALKTELAELKKQLESVSVAKKATDDMQVKLAGIAEALTGKKEPEALTPEQILEAYTSQVDSKINQEVGKVKKELDDAYKVINALKESNLKNVRKAIFAENSGQIIEELLVGETEEEIRSKVDIAKATFSKYFAAKEAEQEAEAKEQKKQKPLPNTTKLSSGTSTGSTTEDIDDKYLNLDDKAYKENESDIKAYLNKLIRSGK